MSTGALPTSELGSEVSTVFVPRGPIGFEFSVKTQGSVIVISQVRQGGTAERAGLKCGSILRAVNRQPIDGLTFLQVSNMIRRTSGLITEISVVEPREPEDRNTRDGLLTSVPTKFDATPSTAPDKSASQDSTTPTSGNNGRASAVQNEPTPDSPQLLSLLPVHYSPSPLQFTETSTARDGKTAPPRPQFRTRPAVSGTSPRAGLTGSRELRRQAILLPNDAVCVREQSSDPVKFTKPNFFSFRQPRLQHGVSEGTTRVDDAPQQPDNSFFGAADTSPPSPSEEVIPSLVRRQAYSSLSMRRRGAKVEDGGPRFLPAHPLATPAALPPRDNSLSFTFLPKHTPGHQAFATGGQLEASSPAFVDSTKKKSDLSDKVRNQLQRHNSASDELHLGNSVSSSGQLVPSVPPNAHVDGYWKLDNTNEFTPDERTNNDVFQRPFSKSDEMATSEIHLHLDSDCDDVFSLSSDCDLSPLDYPRNRRNSCFAIVPNVENLQTVKTTHRGRTWSKGFASDRRCHDVCEESKRLSCSQSTRANPTLHDAKPKMPHFPYEVLGTRKSCPDPGIRRRLATDVTVAGGKRTLEESTVPSSAHAFGDFEDAGCATGKPVDGNSKFRLFYSAATPILRGIANVLGNARGGSGVTSGTSTSPMDPNEQARRIAAVVGEPPDFSELQNPGPVFGAPLENQISSADFPNVPLILHAMVTALELNGLHHVGLYRVPGKQKEVSRFVCLANMTSLDPDVLLHLDAWKDARVLTSAIKLFFRRLPEPILDQASWEPLASIVPEMSSEWTTASLAYALLAILVKLSKLQTRAITMQTPLNIVPSTRNVDYNKGLDLWRLATLDFLFDHLRRLEALAVTNQCSFACIAVCFGPSLFGGDSTIQPKLNMVLEVMLQHWPWLKTSLFNTGGGGASQDAVATARVGRVLPDALGSLRAIKPPTLAQTEAYVEQFFARGTDLGQSSDSLPTSFMAADTNGDTSKYPSNDVVSAVKEIFTRAGLISENVATISPGSSCRPDTKGDSTAHTVLKSVPPGNREADCGIQTPRASVSFRNGSVKDGRVCGQDEKIRKVPTFRKTNF